MVKEKLKSDGQLLRQFKGTKLEQLQALYSEWSGCKKCNLSMFRDAQNNAISGNTLDIVFGDGNPDSRILILGEAPGEEEESSQIPFIGRAGQLLNQILAITSADPEIKKMYHSYNTKKHRTKSDEENFTHQMVNWRKNNYFITDVVSCRPPENRPPSHSEMDICWERLWNIVYIVDPIVIIACGNSALSSMLKKRKTVITSYRSEVYDCKFSGRICDIKYPVIPTYHPTHLLRKADWNTKGGDWDKTLLDWRSALTLYDQFMEINHNIPIPDRTPNV